MKKEKDEVYDEENSFKDLEYKSLNICTKEDEIDYKISWLIDRISDINKILNVGYEPKYNFIKKKYYLKRVTDQRRKKLLNLLAKYEKHLSKLEESVFISESFLW